MSIDNAKEMPDWLPKSSIFFCQKWVFRKNGKKKCGSILYFGTTYFLPNLSFLRHSQIIFIRQGFSLPIYETAEQMLEDVARDWTIFHPWNMEG